MSKKTILIESSGFRVDLDYKSGDFKRLFNPKDGAAMLNVVADLYQEDLISLDLGSPYSRRFDPKVPMETRIQEHFSFFMNQLEQLHLFPMNFISSLSYELAHIHSPSRIPFSIAVISGEWRSEEFEDEYNHPEMLPLGPRVLSRLLKFRGKNVDKSPINDWEVFEENLDLDIDLETSRHMLEVTGLSEEISTLKDEIEALKSKKSNFLDTMRKRIENFKLD